MPRYRAADIDIWLCKTPLAASTNPNPNRTNSSSTKENLEQVATAFANGQVLAERDVPCFNDDFRTHFVGGSPFLFVKTSPHTLTSSQGPTSSQSRTSIDLGNDNLPLNERLAGVRSSLIGPTSNNISNTVVRDTQDQKKTTHNSNRSDENDYSALHLTVRFSHETMQRSLDSTARPKSIKFEVYLNGELSGTSFLSSRYGKANTVHTLNFSGRRFQRLVERAWLCPESSQRPTVARVSTKAVRVDEQEVLKRWKSIQEALSKQANSYGRLKNCQRPPAAEFLAKLASMPAPPGLAHWQTIGGPQFAIIDVVSTLGEGSKDPVSKGYCLQPTILRDPEILVSTESIDRRSGAESSLPPHQTREADSRETGSTRQAIEEDHTNLHIAFQTQQSDNSTLVTHRETPSAQRDTSARMVHHEQNPIRLPFPARHTSLSEDSKSFDVSHERSMPGNLEQIAPYCDLSYETISIRDQSPSLPEPNPLESVTEPATTDSASSYREVRRIKMSLGNDALFVDHTLRRPRHLSAGDIPPHPQLGLARRSSHASSLSPRQRLARSPYSTKHSDVCSVLQNDFDQSQLDLSWVTQEFLDSNKTTTMPSPGALQDTTKFAKDKPKRNSLRTSLQKELKALGAPMHNESFSQIGDELRPTQRLERYKTHQQSVSSGAQNEAELFENKKRAIDNAAIEASKGQPRKTKKTKSLVVEGRAAPVRRRIEKKQKQSRHLKRNLSQVQQDLNGRNGNSGQSVTTTVNSITRTSPSLERQLGAETPLSAPQELPHKRRRMFPDAALAAEVMRSWDDGTSQFKPRPRPSYKEDAQAKVESKSNLDTAGGDSEVAEANPGAPTPTPTTSPHLDTLSSKVLLPSGSGMDVPSKPSARIALHGKASAVDGPQQPSLSRTHTPRNRGKSAASFASFPVPDLCKECIVTYAEEGQKSNDGEGILGIRQVHAERSGEFQEAEVLLGVRFLVVDDLAAGLVL